MKKITALLLALTLCLGIFACGKEEKPSEAEKETEEVKQTQESAETEEAPEINSGVVVGGVNPEASVVKNCFSEEEYNNYYDFFFVSTGDEPLNKEYTKEGVFAKIYDNFNDCERYYVWGYGHEDMSVDYQWEFLPSDPTTLPAPGSYIKMTGTLVKDTEALDAHWFKDARVEVMESYEGEKVEIDLTTLNPTLTRVQILSMVYFPTMYNSKPIKIYGRINDEGGIEHPYLENGWSLPLDYERDMPKEGSWVTVYGSYYGTYKEDCKIIAEKISAE